MLLHVTHSTAYSFDPPRSRVIQSHRMTPAGNAGQTIRDWHISADGARFGASFIDGAGDTVTTMTVPGPVSALTIAVEGTVETADTSGVLRGHRETMAPDVYLRRTRMTAPGMSIVALADRVSDNESDPLKTAHSMAGLVAEAITYSPGTTHAAMTAAEALELGHGVCQDHAQVLISLARVRGVPARYVTGYLFSDAEDGAAEASHAWAELHVPDLGWVGFDPANRCCPDARYIRIGSGLDAADAAPIRGISLGAGEETMDIDVSVAAQQ